MWLGNTELAHKVNQGMNIYLFSMHMYKKPWVQFPELQNTITDDGVGYL